MRIVFCAAEATPFAKVGGLGDVIGSLPKALANQGEEVIVCIPRYGCIAAEDHHLVETGITFTVSHAERDYRFRVLESVLPKSTVPIYFFDNQELFGRLEAIYPYEEMAFEVHRLEVFGKAVFEFLKQLSFQPDILHLHDWHTSPVAVYLNELYPEDPFFQNASTVLSLHNMAYQGVVGDTNWLKEGLLHSDALVAVSPTYAKEILTPEGGGGLEDVVRSQQHKLYGVLNGLDMDLFNPATDPFLPCQYDSQTVESGKAACKEALQVAMGLDVTPSVPLFGMVARLVEQKGLDLLMEILPQLTALPAQFAVLGVGEEVYEDALKAMNTASRNIRSMIGFNMALGQHVYAGSDFFLMPSHFEPCGLGQMIAFRYGAVPLVRKTGGLADTVFDIQEAPSCGNGLVFEEYTSEALLQAIHRAIAVWNGRNAQWWDMVKQGMSRDMSWNRSAQAYQEVYHLVYRRTMQGV